MKGVTPTPEASPEGRESRSEPFDLPRSLVEDLGDTVGEIIVLAAFGHALTDGGEQVGRSALDGRGVPPLSMFAERVETLHRAIDLLGLFGEHGFARRRDCELAALVARFLLGDQPRWP